MISISTLRNGLILIIEEIPHLESAAYELSLPGGIICDPETRVGSSLILGELCSRGAGDLDSRALSNAFEDSGIRHGESGGHDRISFRGSLLAEKLDRALELVSLMVRAPQLPESEIPSIQSLLIQDISSLPDSPSRRVMVELSKRYFPQPYGRPGMGEEQGIKECSRSDLEKLYEAWFRPDGAVLSIAGNIKTADVLKSVEKHFGSWKGKGPELPKYGEFPQRNAGHIDFESAQLQIALAYPSSKFGDGDYYVAKVATGIMSGGMFGRLFIEVREKRGLCYSVYARHSATLHYGMVTAYAGTTPERAQETLDVMLKELRSVAGTVTQEELARSKANIKSSLIISDESAGSRASSNAGDWWIARKVRTLDEIQAGLDAVRLKDVDAFFERHPAQSIALLTLGNKQLKLS